MNGSAVLITGAMAPHLVGLPIGLSRFDPSDVHPLALVVALTALWIALRPPAWTRRIPPT